MRSCSRQGPSPYDRAAAQPSALLLQLQNLLPQSFLGLLSLPIWVLLPCISDWVGPCKTVSLSPSVSFHSFLSVCLCSCPSLSPCLPPLTLRVVSGLSAHSLPFLLGYHSFHPLQGLDPITYHLNIHIDRYLENSSK